MKMKLPRGTRLLTSARQVEAVTSPLRVEILEHLAQAGPSAVADLAALMGRPANAVHYHLKLLHTAGLVRAAGQRRAGKRLEALYELTATCFAVAGNPADQGSLRQMLRTLGATLRLAQREARQALRGSAVCGHGGQRNFHARRLRAPLSAKALGRVNRLLDELEQVFRRAVKRHAWGRRRRPPLAARRAGDRIASLTFLMAPAGKPVASSEPTAAARPMQKKQKKRRRPS